MPKVRAERLREIGRALLVANGVPEAEAATVARHCVSANLAGHDGHGVIQIPGCIDRVKAGHLVPGAPFAVVRESPTAAVVDGNWGFGQVVSERAMRLVIEKARAADLAAATVSRQGHVGRLAAYALMAAEAGMIGMAWAHPGRSPKAVAPFGGREARLGANPWAVAVPSDLKAPLFLDMATSAVAAGKVELAEARGEPIPPGWVVDNEGRPTTDPKRLSAGGALLPLGGPGEGHKGYGLAVIGEVLCGILAGLGPGAEPADRHGDGCFLLAIKVDAFRPLAGFRAEVAGLAARLKNTPTSEGSAGVLYPGEPERAKEAERGRDGVEVEDSTWGKLGDLAEAAGLSAQLGFA